MVWWVKLIIMVVASYVAAALAPKPPQPKPASLDDLDVPQADEGRAVGMVFGHVFIKAPTLAWFGNLTTEKIKKRTGNIFGHTKTTVGFRYKMGLHFALCRSLDMLYEIIVGERVAWRGPLAASAEDHIGQWELFGGDKKEGGVEGYFDFMLGDAAQGQNAYLLGQLGDPLPAFRGVVSVVFKGGRVTANTPYVKPWWFRCERVYATHNGSPQWYEEKAAVPMVSFTPPASATSMLIEYGNFDVDAVTNSATTADGMKLVAAYDLQTVFDTDVVYLWPAYNGLYLGLSSWGIPAYSGPGTGSMYRTAVVKNDEHTISGFGPGGPYDGYQAAFDAAVASAPYTLTGATRYRFGNVDDPFLDNTGGASWYFETWRDSTTTYNAMNPAHILRECLTDPYMRMNYPESMIDDESFETAADTFHTEGMGLCLFWSNQTTVREFIQTVLDHCGAVYYADPFTGKFVLKAIRGDYDVGALEEFDESSIINVESFERSGPGEVVNEISVQYFDISTGKDAVITVQDLASINSQGAIVAETRQYPGLSHPALAARVAQRDLTASTASLARIKVRFTRKAATIRPGDVIKFSWAKLGLTSLICRVMDVSYGGLNNGEIRAELAEDVFGLPSSSYQEEQPGGWDPASGNPQPVADQHVLEGTYWDVSRELGTADFAALSDTSGFVYTLAEAASSAQFNYNIYSRTGSAAFELSIEEQPYAAKATLAAVVGRDDATLEIDETAAADFIATVAVGDRLLLPGGTTEEQLEVTDLTNLATGVIGVNRGLLDTTPQEFAIGADVWLLALNAEDFGRDAIEQFDGDAVDYKLVSLSSEGESALELTPAVTLTYDSRIFRPYPPGKIRIDGEAFPAGDVAAEFTVTWAHRDRTQQVDAFVSQNADSIGPEAGTTYNLYFYDADTDTVQHHTTGLTGTSYVMPDIPGDFNARLELEAQRDGAVSWERQIREFSYTGSVSASGSYLISGGIVTHDTGLTYDVTAATYVINGSPYSSPDDSVTLTAADPLLSRIDVVAVDTSGNVVVIEGTPSASPVAPSVNPSTQLLLTTISVPAESAGIPSHSHAASEIIYDNTESALPADDVQEAIDALVSAGVSPSIHGTWRVDPATTASDPGSGDVRFNNATPASVTEVYIHESNRAGSDCSKVFAFIEDGSQILFQQRLDSTRFLRVEVNAAPTDHGAWWTLPVTILDSGLLPQTNTDVSVVLFIGGGGAGVTDGDKGDITVSGSGATWAVNNDAITFSKMQNVSAASRILGRKTAGSGDVEECTLSEILDFIGSAAQGDILYRGASGWARLAAGASGQFLKTLGTGADPAWGTAFVSSGVSLVASAVVSGSASTTLSVSGLDLNADEAYLISIEASNASGSTHGIAMYYNSDTTASNYDVQIAGASHTTAANGRANNGILRNMTAGTSMSVVGWMRRDLTDRVHFMGNGSTGVTSAIDSTTIAHDWRTTATNVTGITLNASVASSLAIGTSIKVYKMSGGIASSAAPASAGAAGVAGTLAFDSSYLYVCTAANTWKRVAISSW